MKHVGDITKIHGYDLEPVDVICGGSPCQDLSVAGKRAGLAGERSGLFMEQIRIIKEMREHDKASGRTGADVRPRFCIWENVPGALSSGTPKGADFQAVLTEFVKVVEPEAPDVPIPAKGWPTWGCLMGDGFSLCYRIHDAQYWGKAILDADGNVVEYGTPQRRRRIALVLDAGGDSAPEVLFEREGVCGDSGESGTPWEGTAGGTAEGSAPSVWCIDGDKLGKRERERAVADSDSQNPKSSTHSQPKTGTELSTPKTLQIRGGCEGGGKGPLIQDDCTGTIGCVQDKTLFQPLAADLYNGSVDANTTGTLQSAAAHNTGSNNTVLTPYIDSVGGQAEKYTTTTGTLKACHYKFAPCVGVDVYNQEITGDTAASMTAAVGGSNTSGPKVLDNIDDILD